MSDLNIIYFAKFDFCEVQAFNGFKPFVGYENYKNSHFEFTIYKLIEKKLKFRIAPSEILAFLFSY